MFLTTDSRDFTRSRLLSIKASMVHLEAIVRSLLRRAHFSVPSSRKTDAPRCPQQAVFDIPELLELILVHLDPLT